MEKPVMLSDVVKALTEFEQAVIELEHAKVMGIDVYQKTQDRDTKYGLLLGEIIVYSEGE
jgi:hypothetical protein